MKSMLKTTTAILLLAGSVAFAAGAANAKDHNSGGSNDRAEHAQHNGGASKQAGTHRSGIDGSTSGDTSGDGSQTGGTSGDGTGVGDSSGSGTDVADTQDDSGSVTTLKTKHR